MPSSLILEKCSVLNVQSNNAINQLLPRAYAKHTTTAKEDTKTYALGRLTISAKIAE